MNRDHPTGCIIKSPGASSTIGAHDGSVIIFTLIVIMIFVLVAVLAFTGPQAPGS
jgi:hypothetical protein